MAYGSTATSGELRGSCSGPLRTRHGIRWRSQGRRARGMAASPRRVSAAVLAAPSRGSGFGRDGTLRSIHVTGMLLRTAHCLDVRHRHGAVTSRGRVWPCPDGLNSTLDECEQVGVDRVCLRRRHAVRKSLVRLQPCATSPRTMRRCRSASRWAAQRWSSTTRSAPRSPRQNRCAAIALSAPQGRARGRWSEVRIRRYADRRGSAGRAFARVLAIAR